MMHGVVHGRDDVVGLGRQEATGDPDGGLSGKAFSVLPGDRAGAAVRLRAGGSVQDARTGGPPMLTPPGRAAAQGSPPLRTILVVGGGLFFFLL